MAKQGGGRVLVIGCSDTTSGRAAAARVLSPQAKAFSALGCCSDSTTVAAAASKVRNASDDDDDGGFEIIETPLAAFKSQITSCIRPEGLGVIDVIKIGALFSAESVGVIADAIHASQQSSPTPPPVLVLDAEPVFKTQLPTPPAVVTAVRERLLPLTTVLSATVPEAKLLLDDAGVAVEYPKSMEDVAAMARALRGLGPKNVVIKREIFDETAMKTTLHFVLCGGAGEVEEEEPLVVGSRYDNPRGVMGASYSIPPAIAANLALGQNVPQAVRAAFEFVGAALKEEGLF